MKNLVLKDIRLLGAYNIFFLGLPLGLGILGTIVSGNIEATLVYILAVLIPASMLVIRVSINDMTNNVNPFLISLPVKRFDIVMSRYISIFIYTFLISGFVFLSSNISRSLLSSGNDVIFSLTSMLFTVSIMFLLLSVNIPLQYYDARKTQIFNALFYAALILIPNLIGRMDINLLNNRVVQKILSLDFKVLAPIVLLISLIIYVASSFISKEIYSKKEF